MRATGTVRSFLLEGDAMTTAKFGWGPRLGGLVVGLVLAAGAAAQEEKKAAPPDEAKKADPEREALLKLNSVTGEDAEQARFDALTKDKAKAKKAVALALKMRQEARGKDKPFNYTASMILGRVALSLRDHDSAETLFDDGVEAAAKVKDAEKTYRAYAGLADTYFDAKKYTAVVEACEKALDIRANEIANAQIFMLERLVQAKAKLGQFDEALKITAGLVQAGEDSGNAWYFLQLKGYVQREAGKNEDAIKTHLEVIEKLDAAKALKGDFRDRMKDRNRYVLSGLYVDAKDIDNAAKQLQTLIKRNPDSATYKNDLGFIWCDNDMNLEESEKLIREALDLDKKAQEKLKADGKVDEVRPNAAYLDSLGWVLFKQKKYKEALEYLKKACEDEDDGNHLEIWDHLADCHMALGQKKDAVAAWEKGLTMEDLSKRDAERRRKVTEKLKKARAGD
jgi:tetratricopeptide (TPR) repeat protein